MKYTFWVFLCGVNAMCSVSTIVHNDPAWVLAINVLALAAAAFAAWMHAPQQLLSKVLP